MYMSLFFKSYIYQHRKRVRKWEQYRLKPGNSWVKKRTYTFWIEGFKTRSEILTPSLKNWWTQIPNGVVRNFELALFKLLWQFVFFMILLQPWLLGRRSFSKRIIISSRAGSIHFLIRFDSCCLQLFNSQTKWKTVITKHSAMWALSKTGEFQLLKGVNIVFWKFQSDWSWLSFTLPMN